MLIPRTLDIEISNSDGSFDDSLFTEIFPERSKGFFALIMREPGLTGLQSELHRSSGTVSFQIFEGAHAWFITYPTFAGNIHSQHGKTTLRGKFKPTTRGIFCIAFLIALSMFPSLSVTRILSQPSEVPSPLILLLSVFVFIASFSLLLLPLAEIFRIQAKNLREAIEETTGRKFQQQLRAHTATSQAP